MGQLSVLLSDENIILEGYNGRNSQSGIEQLIKAMLKFIDTVIKLIVACINSLKRLVDKVFMRIGMSVESTFIMDPYGYVDAIRIAIPMLQEYKDSILDLMMYDRETNKTSNVSDTLRDSLIDKTVRIVQPKTTKREISENILRCFKKCDAYKELLHENIQKTCANHPLPVPMKYPFGYLTKTFQEPLNHLISDLTEIKKDVEISKEWYAKSKFLYRVIHSDDIRRNKDILNHVISLIEITEKYKAMYVKLLEPLIK